MAKAKAAKGSQKNLFKTHIDEETKEHSIVPVAEAAVTEPELNPVLALADVNEVAIALKTLREKSVAARLALSAITVVETEEQDVQLAELIIKARNTYELCEELRKEKTRFLDAGKKLLMEPEKEIKLILDDKIRLRDGFLKEKLRKQAEADLEVETKRLRTDALIRFKAKLEKQVLDGLFKLIITLNDTMIKHINSMTLQNWQAKFAAFVREPKMKQEVYDAWFVVAEFESLLTEDDVERITGEVKRASTYDLCNNQFLGYVKPIIAHYKTALLSERYKLLEAIAKAEAEDNQQDIDLLNKLLSEETDKSWAAAASNLTDVQQQAEEAIEANAEDAVMLSDFTLQAEIQNERVEIKNVKTTRYAVIDCKEEDLLGVALKLMQSMFKNPLFMGVLKINRDGTYVGDIEEGVPTYVGWMQDLLAFYVTNNVSLFTGIRVVEIKKTIQKS